MILGVTGVDALSCMPLRDRYVVACTKGDCTARFLAGEVRAYGVCSKRLVIEEIPDWAARPVVDTVRAAVGREADGVLVVTVDRRWHEDRPRNETEVRASLDSHLLWRD